MVPILARPGVARRAYNWSNLLRGSALRSGLHFSSNQHQPSQWLPFAAALSRVQLVGNVRCEIPGAPDRRCHIVPTRARQYSSRGSSSSGGASQRLGDDQSHLERIISKTKKNVRRSLEKRFKNFPPDVRTAVRGALGDFMQVHFRDIAEFAKEKLEELRIEREEAGRSKEVIAMLTKHNELERKKHETNLRAVQEDAEAKLQKKISALTNAHKLKITALNERIKGLKNPDAANRETINAVRSDLCVYAKIPWKSPSEVTSHKERRNYILDLYGQSRRLAEKGKGPWKNVAALHDYIMVRCLEEIPKTTSEKDAGYRRIFCQGERTRDEFLADIDKVKAIMFGDSATRRKGNAATHTMLGNSKDIFDAANQAPIQDRRFVQLGSRAAVSRKDPNERRSETRRHYNQTEKWHTQLVNKSRKEIDRRRKSTKNESTS